MKKSKIAIIYSTNKYSDFIEEYNEKLLENTYNHYNIQIFPIKNYNDFSLSNAYNIGIEKVKEFTNNNLDEWILLFVHHDIQVMSHNWDKTLLNNFNTTDYDILFVAGGIELHKNGTYYSGGQFQDPAAFNYPPYNLTP